MPELPDNSVPVIFRILEGYFLKNEEENIRKKGIFRVTSHGPTIRVVETHIAKGNFAHLDEVHDVYLVANYWKRLLMTMRTPLIPYDSYTKFENLDQVSERERYELIRKYVGELDALRFNTLRFHIQFFRKVVEHEPTNLMTAYNMAVTVGPNIFRPQLHSS